MKKLWTMLLLALVVAVSCFGCSGKDESKKSEVPTFSLSWSEYPSWSAFGVAADKGLKDKLAAKYNIKVNFKQLDYDPCITMYASGVVDAVCITNMDVLSPALGRDSVAIMPTSTSVGADAWIVVGDDTIDTMKGKNTYGLEKSVSQFAFESLLEKNGKSPKDYPFKNMDPAAAAQAMQTMQKDITGIMVWNPFVLQTLRTRQGSKVLFDSSAIPEQIIDMVVVGKDVLAKPGGERFAAFIVELYYEFNKMLADPKQADALYVALGSKFSSLGLEDMKKCCVQTRFYKTPEAGLGLYESKTFREATMPHVVDFCVSHSITAKKPVVGFENPNAQLNFTTKYMKAAK